MDKDTGKITMAYKDVKLGKREKLELVRTSRFPVRSLHASDQGN